MGRRSPTSSTLCNLLATTGAYGCNGDLFVDGGARLTDRMPAFAALRRRPCTTGMPYLDVDAVYAHLRADQLHRQAGFHVIGDAAMTAVTTALARAGRRGRDTDAGGVRPPRRARGDGRRAATGSARCGVIASMQPALTHSGAGRDRCEQRLLARRRASAMNDFAAMAKAWCRAGIRRTSPVT